MAVKKLTIDDVEKEIGIDPIAFDGLEPTKRLSTGVEEMDDMLKGGWPVGRCVEFYALEGVGKTAICMSTMRVVQKAWAESGREAVLFDLERKYNPLYALKFYGLESPMRDPETKIVKRTGIRIYKPKVAEDALNMGIRLVETGKVSLMIYDSAPALVPRDEFEGVVGKSYRQQQARLVSQAFRMLLARAEENDCVVIFINQLRKIGDINVKGNVFPKYDTTGAYSLRYLCSCRVWAGRKGLLTPSAASKEKIGHLMQARVDKDQNGGCFGRSALFKFYYDRGFCKITPLLDKAISLGILQKISAKSAWISFDGLKLQGVQKWIDYLSDEKNAETLEKMKVAVNASKENKTDELPVPQIDDDDCEF